MFEKLVNRFFFTGTIILENELHIGSGKGDGSTDALFIRDNRGFPFIPGSSVRGSLRSTIERIVPSLGIDPCLLIEGNPCISTSDSIQSEFKSIKDKKDSSKIEEIRKFISNDKKVCPICQLFGSTIAASKIKISDLKLLNSGITRVRDCVAIDRDTETAKEGAKFDFETISNKSEFQFELIGENLTLREIRLLAVGIQEMDAGNFWLGGNTSRGLGKCKLKDLKIEYFDTPDSIKEYLINKTLIKIDDNSKFFKSIEGLVHQNEVTNHV